MFQNYGLMENETLCESIAKTHCGAHRARRAYRIQEPFGAYKENFYNTIFSIGTLREDDQVNLGTGLLSLRDFAERLKQEHQSNPHPPVFRKIRIAYKGQQETYYSYCSQLWQTTPGDQL